MDLHSQRNPRRRRLQLHDGSRRPEGEGIRARGEEQRHAEQVGRLQHHRQRAGMGARAGWLGGARRSVLRQRDELRCGARTRAQRLAGWQDGLETGQGILGNDPMSASAATRLRQLATQYHGGEIDLPSYRRMRAELLDRLTGAEAEFDEASTTLPQRSRAAPAPAAPRAPQPAPAAAPAPPAAPRKSGSAIYILLGL